MNNVAISGNLTAKPELRNTQNGKQTASFTVAINEGKDRTEFVNCVAWEKTAELIAQYCDKGDRMACTGRIQTDKVEKDGATKYYTKIVVHTFDFPPKRSEQSAPQTSVPEGLEDEIPFARHLDFMGA